MNKIWTHKSFVSSSVEVAGVINTHTSLIQILNKSGDTIPPCGTLVQYCNVSLTPVSLESHTLCVI